jgi:hypothetical protein
LGPVLILGSHRALLVSNEVPCAIARKSERLGW